jgi:iron complex outermembrane receptor protein
MPLTNYCSRIVIIIIILFQANESFCQQQDSLTWNKLKNLSLEQLMNIEVTSVSKHPENLEEAASAIQVITREDIRNSGAKTLPEALRLASNLQVAQVNSSQWAISARGFNNVLANKLLVLIDGRTVYTPLYAGVFWDVQNVVLEDVDRIEVISGPGGTMWGANAVNGVINIITKNSKDTKGLFAEAAAGSNLPGMGSLRYGGQLGSKISYRLYGTGFKMGNTLLTNGKNANDDWTMRQGGFRMDWDASQKDIVSFQGDIYHAKPNPPGAGGDTSSIAKGDNLLVRWNHAGGKSDFQFQAFYDHTNRHFDNGLIEDLKTYDIEWQNRNQLGQRHELTYGMDFRMMDHNVNNLPLFGFFPGHKTLYLYSGFIQDKIMLVRDRLHLTIGEKLEHNSYTGFENQPNLRIAWTPAENQTIWWAVSHAVRTPSRIDRDFTAYIAPNAPFITGTDSFISEKLTAYELGWRLQPVKTLSISLSTFYNVYDDIRSAEPSATANHLPITLANGVKGNSYGVELALSTQLAGWWNLKGGYTFFKKDLSLKAGSKDANQASAESDDPEHQFVIQSSIKLPAHLELGTVVRYIGKLPKPYVADYLGLDLRIGWKLNKALDLNIIGQNLLDERHPEFIPASPSAREIERSVYGKLSLHF